MAKKSKKANSGLNLILTIGGLVTAVLTGLSLLLNFVTGRLTVKALGATTTTNTNYNLQDWFKFINDRQDFDEISGWNLARVFLIITLVLVALVAVMLVIKLLVNHKTLNFATLALSGLCVISALIFFIATIVGANALKSTLGNSSYTYLLNIGVYGLTIGAIVTAALAMITARKIK